MENSKTVSALPEGMKYIFLEKHPDSRGSVTEIFRKNRAPFEILQWNTTFSQANVMRGPHFHLKRHDYIIVIHGSMGVGFCDLRRGSPTEKMSRFFELSAEETKVLIVPPGILHGFVFEQPGIYLQGSTTYWTPSDDVRIHWKDPELGIPWRAKDPILSKEDAGAPLLRSVENQRIIWKAS